MQGLSSPLANECDWVGPGFSAVKGAADQHRIAAEGAARQVWVEGQRHVVGRAVWRNADPRIARSDPRAASAAGDGAGTLSAVQLANGVGGVIFCSGPSSAAAAIAVVAKSMPANARCW